MHSVIKTIFTFFFSFFFFWLNKHNSWSLHTVAGSLDRLGSILGLEVRSGTLSAKHFFPTRKLLARTKTTLLITITNSDEGEQEGHLTLPLISLVRCATPDARFPSESSIISREFCSRHHDLPEFCRSRSEFLVSEPPLFSIHNCQYGGYPGTSQEARCPERPQRYVKFLAEMLPKF